MIVRFTRNIQRDEAFFVDEFLCLAREEWLMSLHISLAFKREEDASTTGKEILGEEMRLLLG